jgi:hypothetical protein
MRMPARAALVARAFALLVIATVPAAAQPAPKVPDPAEWKITDNSFLVEEAFNQEAGIVQNIFGFQRLTIRDWQFTFTQEWPAPGTRHQLSYTIPVQALGGTSGLGDVLINYRLQALEEGDGRPAFAPRVSAILPTGSRAAGAGTHGVQVSLPFSKRRDDFYFHWNGGVTWQWTGDGDLLTSPVAAGSIIYRARQMLNLMLETVIASSQHVVATTISPGVRGGWNVSDDKQIVIGAAVPITHSAGETSHGLFLYFSYEGPVTGLPRK